MKKGIKNKMQLKLHIRKGDMVKVISGADKGKQGRVLDVIIYKRKAFVEGVNFVHKHKRPDKENQTGRIIKQEAPVHLSNLMIVDPSTGEATKIGRRVEGGKLVRFAKKSDQTIK